MTSLAQQVRKANWTVTEKLHIPKRKTLGFSICRAAFARAPLPFRILFLRGYPEFFLAFWDKSIKIYPIAP
jgi:hypothetical protein